MPIDPPSRLMTKVARSAATAGRRRVHFTTRSLAEIGRARIGRPSRNRCNSSASSRAEPYRRRGSFSRHFKQIVSRSRSTAGFKPPRRHRLVTDNLDHGVHRRGRLERRPARHQGIERRPQRVDVGRRTDLTPLAPGLLRRHVAGRPHDLARAASGRYPPATRLANPKSVTRGLPC